MKCCRCQVNDLAWKMLSGVICEAIDGPRCDSTDILGMRRYRHAGGESGVAAYDTGPRSITIRFKDGNTYRYTYAKPGAHHVEAMKVLAEEGRGLATYVNQHVRGDYAARLD